MREQYIGEGPPRQPGEHHRNDMGHEKCQPGEEKLSFKLCENGMPYIFSAVEPRGVLRPASQADRHAVLAGPGWEVRHAKGGTRGKGIKSFFGHYLISPKIGYSNANWSLNAYKNNFTPHFFVIRGKK